MLITFVAITTINSASFIHKITLHNNDYAVLVSL